MRQNRFMPTALCLVLMAACAVMAADNGGAQMDYRVTENHYGPLIHFNDWKIVDGEGSLHAPGGTVQLLTDATADLMRDDYPLPGGGDVELTLTFNFERIDADSAAEFYFHKDADATGFRVRLDSDGVTVFHKDDTVYSGDPVSMDQKAVHEITVVTLAESYSVHLDGGLLAEGRLDPPYTENDGRLGVVVENAGLRIITCEENFIVHDVDFPEWERGDLVWEDPCNQTSLDENWVNNGEAPTVTDDAIIWNPMSVNMLRQRFEGPIAIDCVVTPQEDSAKERDTGLVTDAIFLWMMDHPNRDLFEFMEGLENASLLNYMDLPFYWVDFGGTNNKTTRFRKNPQRHMIRQFDDRPRLLKRYHTYEVTMVQNGNVQEFWVDGERWIQTWDPDPLTSGYIGFRAYVAGLAMHGLKVWRIHE